MMGYSERIADEAAHHYAELRQRRVPRALAWFMAMRFHRDLIYSVLQDDQFKPVVGRMLAPVTDGETKGR